MKILITGCCGFIGSHLCENILKNNLYDQVIGIDNMNDYYDIKIKENNLKILYSISTENNFKFFKEDICETKIISVEKPDLVCHLASMAGVRYSIKNPAIYEKNNIAGFLHILQECVKNNIKKIVFASSSSVYGLSSNLPFSEDENILICNSPYACTKLSMEIFARTYTQLYDLNITSLRFFTVYGPRGRPDMAAYKYLNKIYKNEKIEQYGDGEQTRDFTYIDDIIEGIILSLKITNKKFNIYNLGNSSSIKLKEFIQVCEKIVGKKAIIEIKKEQLGDVKHTYANIDKAKKELKYNPKINIEQGLLKMFEWLLESQQIL